MEKQHLLGEIYKIVVDNNITLRNIWVSQIVFTWRWWFGVALTIIPWIIWVKVSDKNDRVHMLFVGLIVGITTNVLDLIGICSGWWYYDHKLTPITVIYIPWDFSLFPVSVMLLLQFKPKVHPFIKAISFAAICAFVLEPFFAWIDLYTYVNWKHWYSFSIYIVLYLMYNKLYNGKFFDREET